jgi:hypothetical protein
MESFVNNLTSTQKDRWLITKEAINNRNDSQEEITSAEQHDLIDEIHDCIDTNDEESLEKIADKAWAEKHIIVPAAVLCEALEFSSSVGNVRLSEKFLSHLKSNHIEFHDENLNYFTCVALELQFKTNSANIDELLEKFEHLYTNSIDDKNAKQIMRICSVIIEDCVAKKGESAVIKMKEKIEMMCEKSQDYRLLFSLWKRLFERYYQWGGNENAFYEGGKGRQIVWKDILK